MDNKKIKHREMFKRLMRQVWEDIAWDWMQMVRQDNPKQSTINREEVMEAVLDADRVYTTIKYGNAPIFRKPEGMSKNEYRKELMEEWQNISYGERERIFLEEFKAKEYGL